MSRARLAIFTSLVILLSTLGIWLAYPAPKLPAVKPPPPSYAVRKDGAVKVPAGFAWDKLSKDELNDFAGLFPKDQTRNKFAMDTLVNSGESVVTSVYEGGGEFAITELTPVIKQNGQGESYVEVGVLTRGIAPSGDQRTIAATTLKLPVKGSHTLMAPVLYGEKNEVTGLYFIDLRAKVQAGSSAIALEASGKYETAYENQRNAGLLDKSRQRPGGSHGAMNSTP